MKTQTNKTIRKVKAASATAGTATFLAAPTVLNIPKVPDTVDEAATGLLVALVTWALGYFVRPHQRDQTVADD